MSKSAKYKKLNEDVKLLLSFSVSNLNQNKNKNEASGSTIFPLSTSNQLDSESNSEPRITSQEMLPHYKISVAASDSSFVESVSEFDDETDWNFDVNLKDDLASWAVGSGCFNDSINKLLGILRKYHPNLPKGVRTLKSTPRSADILAMGNGNYCHYSVKKGLENLFAKVSDERMCTLLELDIGIDGLPLAKSSNSQLWPILGNVKGYEDVFLIGAYL